MSSLEAPSDYEGSSLQRVQVFAGGVAAPFDRLSI